MYKNAKPILEANEDSITWLKGERVDLILKTRAKTIVCLPHIASLVIPGKTLIGAENPKQKFIELTKDMVSGPPIIVTGKNFIKGPGTVIGTEGFNYSVTEKGISKFPHFGGVIIGDNVEIGTNTCVGRGALGDTFIGDDTKIDNLVHIGCNVKIGKRCIIATQSGIGGSCVIGDGVYIGFGCTVKNGITIGDRALIGMGAIVLKDVPAGEVWVGNPAKKLERP